MEEPPAGVDNLVSKDYILAVQEKIDLNVHPWANWKGGNTPSKERAALIAFTDDLFKRVNPAIPFWAATRPTTCHPQRMDYAIRLLQDKFEDMPYAYAKYFIGYRLRRVRQTYANLAAKAKGSGAVVEEEEEEGSGGKERLKRKRKARSEEEGESEGESEEGKKKKVQNHTHALHS